LPNLLNSYGFDRWLIGISTYGLWAGYNAVVYRSALNLAIHGGKVADRRVDAEKRS
jgi:hypothetical protein